MHDNIEPDFSNFKIHDEFEEQPKVVGEINDYTSARALLPSSVAEHIDKERKKSVFGFCTSLVLTGVFCWAAGLPWYGYAFVFLGIYFVFGMFTLPSKLPVPVVGLDKLEFFSFCEAPGSDGGWIRMFSSHCCYKQGDGYKTITKYKNGGKIFTFVSFGFENKEILISIE